MAIAAKDIERIVRKVLDEEQGETADALRELSTLLTEQVIPRLSKSDGDEVDADEDVDTDEQVDSDEDDPMTMSAFDDDDAASPGAGRNRTATAQTKKTIRPSRRFRERRSTPSPRCTTR